MTATLKLLPICILLVACSETPSRNGIARPYPSESVPQRLEIISAAPLKACEAAAENLRKLRCEGLDNFVSTCHRNTTGRKERVVITDEKPVCLSKASTPEQASSCTNNFTCVVRQPAFKIGSNKPFVRH